MAMMTTTSIITYSFINLLGYFCDDNISFLLSHTLYCHRYGGHRALDWVHRECTSSTLRVLPFIYICTYISYEAHGHPRLPYKTITIIFVKLRMLEFWYYWILIQSVWISFPPYFDIINWLSLHIYIYIYTYIYICTSFWCISFLVWSYLFLVNSFDLFAWLPPCRRRIHEEYGKTGPHLNIKTVFPRYGDSHVKDKAVARPSYI